MFSKQELSDYNKSFWEEFKTLMKPYKSVNGKRMSWTSYPTDIKNIYLRLETTKNCIALNFDIQIKNDSERSVYWEQMQELKKVLESIMGEDGNWFENFYLNEGVKISRIQWKQEALNYFNPKDKQEIFTFFKDKLIAFDEFYQEFKDILLFLAD